MPVCWRQVAGVGNPHEQPPATQTVARQEIAGRILRPEVEIKRRTTELDIVTQQQRDVPGRRVQRGHVLPRATTEVGQRPQRAFCNVQRPHRPPVGMILARRHFFVGKEYVVDETCVSR